MKKIDKLRSMLQQQPRCSMRILIQGDPPEYYRSIPWTTNIDVRVPNTKRADQFISFLSGRERDRIIKLKQELNVSDIPDDKLLKDFFNSGKLPGS